MNEVNALIKRVRMWLSGRDPVSKNKVGSCRKIAQQLRALVAPSENPVSVPSTRIAAPNHL